MVVFVQLYEQDSVYGVMHYFYKSADKKYIQHCECGKDPTKTKEDGHGTGCLFKSRKYTIIWRKK